MENKQDKGFTLVELLIVIVILGILATVTVFAVRGITDQGQDVGLQRRPEDPADGHRGVLRPDTAARPPCHASTNLQAPRLLAPGRRRRTTRVDWSLAWSSATTGGKCA